MLFFSSLMLSFFPQSLSARLTPELLERGLRLEEALAMLRQKLPSYAVLVGQVGETEGKREREREREKLEGKREKKG